jgi:hypothetical protein
VLTASCSSTLWYVGARQENRSQIKYKCSRFLQLDLEQQMPQSLIAGNYPPSAHNQDELKKTGSMNQVFPRFSLRSVPAEVNLYALVTLTHRRKEVLMQQKVETKCA